MGRHGGGSPASEVLGGHWDQAPDSGCRATLLGPIIVDMAALGEQEISAARGTILRVLDAIREGTETATADEVARLEAAIPVLRGLGAGRLVVTLDVDGERFAVRASRTGGGTNYDWMSGPNEGYGYSSGRSPTRPVEEHAEDIRHFLSLVDPRTGYIEDA